MRLVAVVSVITHKDAELAVRPVAGRPWISCITDRLARAQSVSRVVVTSRPEWRDLLRLTLDEGAEVVFSTDDPLAVAESFDGGHDAVAFCPLRQLFVDPARLDALAAEPTTRDTARVMAVLACAPAIALTGGAFLQILTRTGLRAALEGRDLLLLPTLRIPQWPEPREMHLDDGDVTWAATVHELLLPVEATDSDTAFERVLSCHGLGRFPGWDGIGELPRSLLTVRSLREPLFGAWVRHLSRFCPAGIDVICAEASADATAALRGVARVWPFKGASFSIGALDAETRVGISASRYDVCALPRLEPTGHGYDNLLPLAQASGAKVALWIDIFGRSGVLAGKAGGWDSTLDASPLIDPGELLARGRAALDRYTSPRASGQRDLMVPLPVSA